MHKQLNEQLLKSKDSYEKLISEHEQKLADYKKNPYAHDNQGTLSKAPPDVRKKIIEGRINALLKQIAKQKGELQKILRILKERGVIK